MSNFMDRKFMLDSKTAEELFFGTAQSLPIIDYHCHLSAKDILADKTYDNITQVWLSGDHYKWRCMRTNGIAERFITGDATDKEKFMAFAETMPFCIGNPVYTWSHLELQRYFGIDTPLDLKSAPAIWENTKKKLKNMSARQMIAKFHVKVLCTTDDPIDDLKAHEQLKGGKLGFDVFPTFRPDKALNIKSPDFLQYMKWLSKSAGVEIDSFNTLLDAFEKRIAYFNALGCRLSDHSLEYVPFSLANEADVTVILQKVLNGEKINDDEEEKYRTVMLLALGTIYHRYGWTMQLHIGAMRNNNSRMYLELGPDTGFDSMQDHAIAAPLSRFLDMLERDHLLPKTILYNTNPKDNYALAAMLGNFQSTPPGKIQLGSGWWFNDQLDGMVNQMRTLANLGLLSRFVGMLTDSRSFLSYVRHEYFRRIFCSLIGDYVENGEFPNDIKFLKQLVTGVCYQNAKDYFDFPEYHAVPLPRSPKKALGIASEGIIKNPLGENEKE